MDFTDVFASPEFGEFLGEMQRRLHSFKITGQSKLDETKKY